MKWWAWKGGKGDSGTILDSLLIREEKFQAGVARKNVKLGYTLSDNPILGMKYGANTLGPRSWLSYVVLIGIERIVTQVIVEVLVGDQR